MEPRDATSPDGTLRVEYDVFEPKMSHRVYRPRITDTKTGRVLLNLWGTPWDATVRFEADGDVVLHLWRYPGNSAPCTAHVDPEAGTFFFADHPERREPLAAFAQRVEQRHRERERAYLASQGIATTPTLKDRLRHFGAWAYASLMLALGVAFVVVGVLWALSGEGGVVSWLLIVGAAGGLVSAIDDFRNLLRRS